MDNDKNLIKITRLNNNLSNFEFSNRSNVDFCKDNLNINEIKSNKKIDEYNNQVYKAKDKKI